MAGQWLRACIGGKVLAASLRALHLKATDIDANGSLLAEPVSFRPDSADAASAVVQTWRRVEAGLRPVLGQRGVAALFARCVHLVRPTHPCLEGLRDSAAAAINFDAFESVLSQRPVLEIVEAGELLLQTLHALLVSLVGTALTDRLLAGVSVPLPGESISQELPT